MIGAEVLTYSLPCTEGIMPAVPTADIEGAILMSILGDTDNAFGSIDRHVLWLFPLAT